MKVYITLGREHIHRVGGKIFDKDCVVIIEAENEHTGREIAREYFGNDWHNSYSEENWKEEKLKYFPRGYLELE